MGATSRSPFAHQSSDPVKPSNRAAFPPLIIAISSFEQLDNPSIVSTGSESDMRNGWELYTKVTFFP